MAGNTIKGLTVEIGGDTTKLGKALDTIDKKTKDLSSELGAINRLLKLDPGNTELLAQKQRVLAEAVENTRQRLDSLKAAEQVQDQFARGEVSEQQVRALQREIIATTTKLDKYEQAAGETAQEIDRLGEASGDSAKDLDDIGDGAKDAADNVGDLGDDAKGSAKDLDRVENSADAAADEMDDLGDSASKSSEGFSAAAVAVGTFIGNLAMDVLRAAADAVKDLASDIIEVGSGFESAMSEVGAISGATGEELEQLEATAREFGATTTFSAAESADALKYMALAGWDTQQSIDGLPGILNLAAASGMDLAAASDMVTDYLSAFNLEASDSTRFADMLAFAQGNANTTAQGLGEAYKNCAANLNAAGQDVETVTAMLSMMANQGMKGSEAGTALSAVMRDITAKMKKGSIAIGKTNIQVTDAKGNYRDLTDIMADVEAATDGMGDAQRAAALSSTFTADSMRALNLILNAGTDETAAFEEALRGTAADTAAVMNDNLQGDLKQLNSAYEEFGLTIYESASGPLRDLAQTVTTELMPALTGMATGAEGAKEDFSTALSDLATQALGAIGDMLPAIAEIGGQLVSTLVETAVAQMPAMSEVAVSLITTLASSLLEQLPQMIEAGMQIVTNLLQGLTEAIPDITQAIIDLIPKLATALQTGIPQLLQAAIDLLMALVDAIPQIIPPLIEALPELIISLINALLEAIPQLVEGAVQLLLGLVQAIPLIIPPLVEALPQIIEALVNGLLENIPLLLDAAVQLLMGLVEAIPQIIAELIRALPELITTIIDFLKELPDKIWTVLLECIGKFGAWVLELKDKAGEGISNVVSAVVDTIKSLPGDIWDNIAGAVEKVGQWGQDLLDKGMEAAADLVDAVVNGIKSLPDQIRAVGRNLVEGLWNGINGSIDWLNEKIGGFASSVLGGLKSLFGIRSPSTKTTWMGRMLDEGWANGIEENADAPVDAMADVADDMLHASDQINGVTLDRQLQATFNAPGAAAQAGLWDRLDRILAAIERGQVVMLDGKSLVGGTYDQYDGKLGQRRMLAVRGAL